MQQGIKKLQWCEYLKLVFLEILNPLLCRVFANQVTVRNQSSLTMSRATPLDKDQYYCVAMTDGGYESRGPQCDCNLVHLARNLS